MIYIVEIPHVFAPQVWCRASKEQIIDAIDEVSSFSGDTIYDELTGRDLLELFDCASTDEMRADNDALDTLADIIDTHGLNTTFYKGYGDDEYGVEPVDKWQAHIEWNGHDLSSQRVYMSKKEARAALADDSEWRIHQGFEARIALGKELKN